MSLLIQSSSSKGRIPETGQLSTLSPEKRVEAIGKMLHSLKAEQIETLADMMTEILSQGLPVKSDTKVRRAYTFNKKGKLDGEELVNAKTDFLKRTPFRDNLTKDFQYGAGSTLAKGGVHEYSYKQILEYSITTSNRPPSEQTALREALKELEKYDQYRIILSLHPERNDTFIITEKEGEKESFKIEIPLDKLSGKVMKTWYNPALTMRCYTYSEYLARNNMSNPDYELLRSVFKDHPYLYDHLG